MSCKVISVCLPKGGVGKTTTAVNLAASLAVAEKKTLLIDTDSFGASAISLGFTPEKIKAGISEVFSFTHSIDHAIHRTELEYMDFVPSNVNSIQRDDRFSKISENRVVLKNAIRGIMNQYEYIIIKTTIPRNQLLTESTFYGKPIILFNVNCNVSMAYLELAYEIINKYEGGSNIS